MSKTTNDVGTRQDRWARFRFSIIGPLLSAPPESGALQEALNNLSKKQWRHPITGEPVYFGLSTIERWLYHSRHKQDPVKALRSKQREDAGKSRQLSAHIKHLIQQQHRQHPSWSCQLHVDNISTLLSQSSERGVMPSYNTVRRYMKSNGFYKQSRIRKRNTLGAAIAAERLETREVRSFEMDHIHALWHLDFHHGSFNILGRDGKWHKPMLLAILDDRSRLICHAQWYLDETAETLVHGFCQALQKRGLPRALMSDNGSAMISAEFTEGLERLGILHQPTLPYSPYQNAKQEVFWAQVEGRLMAMLEGVKELSLPMLNEATIAWVEFEYHRKIHSEIASTPLERYLKDPNIGRECPNSLTLNQAFCRQTNRKLRRSDLTFSLEGKRFEVPSQYRHLELLHIRYATWNLSNIMLMDQHTSMVLCMLYPQDKSENASGIRRVLAIPNQVIPETEVGMAPLLKDLIAQYAATGLPPAYLTKKEKNDE